MSEETPTKEEQTPSKQMSLEVGRTPNGLVVIARDQQPVVVAPARFALQIAAALVKHASIILSGAQMIDDAIQQLEQAQEGGNGQASNVLPLDDKPTDT